MSGGTIDGGIEVSNGTQVEISAGVISGSLEVSSGVVEISGGEIGGALVVGDASKFEVTPLDGASVPEPTTSIIWSVLGGLAITISWYRRNWVA